MNILLLSAYDAASHHRWCCTLQAMFPLFNWTTLTLPARYFSWRIRGNSLTWAFGQRDILEGDYDLLVATSMVDLSALRGFVPSLAGVPTLVYFHENQFAYPSGERQFSSIEPQLLNLYTALCADRVLFNSEYNRQSFFSGASVMLKKFPDHVPGGLLARIRSVSEVLPVPLASECFIEPVPASVPEFHLLWNHRWEYDKGPDRLLLVVQLLAAAGISLTLHVVGQQFRSQPEQFRQIREQIAHSNDLQCGYWGYIVDANEYRQLLARADVVLSTAVHDFQGLAVLEAVAAGCVPLLPDRLSYSEWFCGDYLYPSNLADPEVEALAIVARIRQRHREKMSGELAPVADVSRFSCHRLSPAYEVALTQTAKLTAHGQLPGE